MNVPKSSLDAALAALPRELPPARELWPAIAARLDDAGQRRVPAARRASPPLALAASLAACALLAALAWNLRTVAVQVGSPAGTAVGAAVVPAGQPQAVALRPAPMDDAAYVAARAKLMATFEERLVLLAPDTQQRVRRDLGTIRAANADLRAALAKDPASALLMQLLASTWRQELELYSSVARTTSPLMQRSNRT